MFRKEVVADEILKERVRSILGRRVRHPDAVEIEVNQGQIELTGRVVHRI